MVVMLHVIDLNYHTPLSGPTDPRELGRRLYQEARLGLDRLMRELAGEPVAVSAIIEEGLPHERICALARECDLMVVGVEKPKPFWRWFSRRTAQVVLEKSPCPVLVVREATSA
jgi:nucleotide-binding universal stress UspA family protein